MTQTKNQPEFSLGEINRFLLSSIDQDAKCLQLHNTSYLGLDDVQLTISHYQVNGDYLDFDEIKIDCLAPGEKRTIRLTTESPKLTHHSVIDVSAVEQTWIKRHWRLLSTTAVVVWAVITLARRMG